MIPIIKPQFPQLHEIRQDIEMCLDTGHVTNNGPYVQSFEAELQAYLHSKIKPLCFCNGEMALYNLIRAHKIRYNIPDGSGVLVPSFTFVGTINAIAANNLMPVFCDVDETLTFSFLASSTMDVNSMDLDLSAYGSGTKLFIAVGVYGNLCDIDKIIKYCDFYKLPLIFDNAPAFGSKYKGKFPNAYGHSEIYSFHATKQLSTMEGGCTVVNDYELQRILIELRDFGQYEKVRGDVRYPGLNSKMCEINAIIGLENIKTIDSEIRARAHIAHDYREKLKDLPLQFMKVSEDVEPSYLYFPIILPEDATAFCEHIDRAKIQVRRYYTACHTLTAYKSGVVLPFTDSIKDRIVSLPCYGSLTVDEIAYICETIKTYFA